MIDSIADKNLILNEIAVDDENVTIPGGENPIPPTPQKPTTTINCSLEVELKPENTVVYVCKDSKQCFSFTALKCCAKGDITITAESNLNVDNFGRFELKNGGICFTPDSKLMANTSKELDFKAESCGVTVLFTVTFVYDPCKCCCGCKS